MDQAIGDTRVNPPTIAQPSDGFDLTVIVPTRNEAENISPLLERLEKALTGRSAEILFVDDSTDQTPRVIEKAAAARSLPLRVIIRPEERRNGLSGAVVEGMKAARGRWFCVIDADLQHPPELIPRLLDLANRTAADIVVASRQSDFLGPVGLSRARALTSQLLTILARMVFPRVLKNVSDPLTGFFLVRGAAIDTDVLQPEGFKILLEVLVRHPDLRVTELHFEFASRHEGQSKADLNEGIRFFRHLSRLRLSVNHHLVRFAIVVMALILLNLGLLGGLTSSGWTVLHAGVVAGAVTIAGVVIGETWVFSDRPRAPSHRRLVAIVLLGSLYLLAVYVPIIWFLSERTSVPAIAAGFAALAFAGFVYYLFSEQWIWTRGLMMRPRASLYYDIHGIIGIASQIPLSDLSYFQVTSPPSRIDLQLRIDRHGTPSRVPGAICYDEQLGRFGFGLTVMPGDFTEIVVSPLLESSPAFLYTNIVEPVLAWQLVTRGFSLVSAGGVRLPATLARADTLPAALLVMGQTNLGYGLGRLCLDGGAEFMGDDRVIIGRDQRVRSFPKPITATREMLPGTANTLRDAVGLRLQRLLYSNAIRRLGLFLSERRLPAATLNTHIQRVIPQPKFPPEDLLPSVIISNEAVPAFLVNLEKGEETISPLPTESAIKSLLEPKNRDFGFHPYPLLLNELARWGGKDWHAEEGEILGAGLINCRMIQWRSGRENWWSQIVSLAIDNKSSDKPPMASLYIKSA